MSNVRRAISCNRDIVKDCDHPNRSCTSNARRKRVHSAAKRSQSTQRISASARHRSTKRASGTGATARPNANARLVALRAALVSRPRVRQGSSETIVTRPACSSSRARGRCQPEAASAGTIRGWGIARSAEMFRRIRASRPDVALGCQPRRNEGSKPKDPLQGCSNAPPALPRKELKTEDQVQPVEFIGGAARI